MMRRTRDQSQRRRSDLLPKGVSSLYFTAATGAKSLTLLDDHNGKIANDKEAEDSEDANSGNITDDLLAEAMRLVRESQRQSGLPLKKRRVVDSGSSAPQKKTSRRGKSTAGPSVRQLTILLHSSDICVAVCSLVRHSSEIQIATKARP